MSVCADLANMAIAPCVIVMVGLPARGKTYMAKKLTRYLNWIGIYAKVFNVGEYRRKAVTDITSTADFFQATNLAAVKIREMCAMEALTDLCNWLEGGGEVAVYDATNSNRARRDTIGRYVSEHHGFKLFFIESICYDKDIIDANIMEVKISSPDYQGKFIDEAIEDFKMRMRNYEAQYEALDDVLDEHLSYIKIFNQGERFLVNRVLGHVESRIVYYLMNCHVLPRTIYIARHGETLLNLEDRIGGESDLSPRGLQYSRALSEFVAGQRAPDLRVWTCLRKQTRQTAAGIDAPLEHWKALNELHCGVCEGLTYDEVESKYPDEYKKRNLDKFHYRYPGGESYQDLVSRLESVIMELERQQNVLVICSQAVARCLLAYFLDKSADELPYLRVPLHTVFKLTPIAYGCKMEQIELPVDAVDTYRPRSRAAILLTGQERKTRRRMTSECQEPDCCAKQSTSSPSPTLTPATSGTQLELDANIVEKVVSGGVISSEQVGDKERGDSNGRKCFSWKDLDVNGELKATQSVNHCTDHCHSNGTAGHTKKSSTVGHSDVASVCSNAADVAGSNGVGLSSVVTSLPSVTLTIADAESHKGTEPTLTLITS